MRKMRHEQSQKENKMEAGGDLVKKSHSGGEWQTGVMQLSYPLSVDPSSLATTAIALLLCLLWEKLVYLNSSI